MFPLLLHVSTGDFESYQAGDFRAVPARLSRVKSPPPSSPKLRDRNQTVSGFKCAAAGQVSFLLLRPFVAVMSSESERMEGGRKEAGAGEGVTPSLPSPVPSSESKEQPLQKRPQSLSSVTDGRKRTDVPSLSPRGRCLNGRRRSLSLPLLR